MGQGKTRPAFGDAEKKRKALADQSSTSLVDLFTGTSFGQSGTELDRLNNLRFTALDRKTGAQRAATGEDFLSDLFISNTLSPKTRPRSLLGLPKDLGFEREALEGQFGVDEASLRLQDFRNLTTRGLGRGSTQSGATAASPFTKAKAPVTPFDLEGKGSILNPEFDLSSLGLGFEDKQVKDVDISDTSFLSTGSPILQTGVKVTSESISTALAGKKAESQKAQAEKLQEFQDRISAASLGRSTTGTGHANRRLKFLRLGSDGEDGKAKLGAAV